MKVVQINVTCGVGSTGKICLAVSRLLNGKGVENYILFSEEDSDYEYGIKYADKLSIKLQALKSRVLGNYGFNSKALTKKLIAKLEEIQPDIVHLHNLHGHGCNLEMLFGYLRKNNIKLYWTFHDCWAFTGYCPHFDMIGCNKWQIQCYDCPQKGAYSFFFDKSDKLYNKKKELFSDLDLTIITPSQWLKGLVKKSFLKDYEVRVINNGIDLDVFKPSESDFREAHGLKDEFLILGVAFNWDERKGIDVFSDLAGTLPKDCRIVLVGTNENTRKLLPSDVIAIDRTENQQQLAEIYSACDLFVNATREDTFPTVNIESLACGTPVLTFATGGSAEIIDSTCGMAVEKNNTDALKNAVLTIKESRPFTREACLKKSAEYRKDDKFKEYADIYFQ
jgi:glycosyltransferase involved in cell wall biosynthesis